MVIGTKAQQPAFSFEIGPLRHIMSISADTVSLILSVSEKTQLGSTDPSKLLEALKEVCSVSADTPLQDTPVTESNFFAAIYQAVPMQLLSAADKQMMTSLLSSIFDAFSLDLSDEESSLPLVASLAELMCGLTVLCGGTKSSKLAFVFDLFDTSSSGEITASALHSYIRSFFTVLCTFATHQERVETISNGYGGGGGGGGDGVSSLLNGGLSGGGKGKSGRGSPPPPPPLLRGRTLIKEEVEAVVDRVASETVAGICESKGQRGTRPSAASVMVTFEDIGDWYNIGGFDQIPWLELLDLKKWESSLSTCLNLNSHRIGGGGGYGDGGGGGGGGGGGAQANGHMANGNGYDHDDDDDEEEEEDEDDDQNDEDDGGDDDDDYEEGAEEEDEEEDEDDDDGGRSSDKYELAFRFVFGDDGEEAEAGAPMAIFITKEDVMNVVGMATATGLSTHTPEYVGDLFLRAAETSGPAAGLLTKEGFDAAVREVVPGTLLTATEKGLFSMLLNSVFFCFDRDFEGTVDPLELAAGFSLLCHGNKSSKLRYGFKMMLNAASGGGGENNDTYIDYRGLWLLLRSVLAMLMGLCARANQRASAEDLLKTIDTAAMWSSVHIFNHATLQFPDLISFAELAHWYTGGGFRACPWLEMLDLKKWKRPGISLPQSLSYTSEDAAAAGGGGGGAGGANTANVTAATAAAAARRVAKGGVASGGAGGKVSVAAARARLAAVAAANAKAEREQEQQQAPAAAEEDVVLFQFPLCLEMDLCITQEDVDFIQRVAIVTCLAYRDPSSVALEFKNVLGLSSLGDLIDRDSYNEVLRSLVPDSWLTPDDMRLLSFAFGNVFMAFDRLETGKVVARDVISGLCFFCSGTKSSKLAFSYQLFEEVAGDENEAGAQQGRISLGGVKSFITNFLGVICSCLGEMLSLTNREMQAVVEDSVDVILYSIFFEDSSAFFGQADLSFEEFGAWYNTGGYEVMPWLELLDLAKWIPMVVGSAPGRETLVQGEQPTASAGEGEEEEDGDDRHGGASGDYEEEEDDEQGDNDAGLRYCFQINDGSRPVYLKMGDDDINAVLAMTQQTDLAHTEVSAVRNQFLAAAVGGMLHKDAYDRCVSQWVPLKRSGGMRPGERSTISVLLSSLFFAFDRDGTLLVDVRELAAGFSVLCRGSKSIKLAFAFDLLDEDGDELLTRRGVWRFIRSFLTVLMALSFASSDLSAELLTRAIDDGAVWTSARIFAQSRMAVPNKLSFEEFAAWYTQIGHEFSPWLELLDLKKWPRH